MKTILKINTFLLFILFFNNSFSQEKQYPHKIILEMELEQIVKLKIPKDIKEHTESTKTNQKYPPKNKLENDECLPENKINIPKTNTIIKEEDYNENNK